VHGLHDLEEIRKHALDTFDEKRAVENGSRLEGRVPCTYTVKTRIHGRPRKKMLSNIIDEKIMRKLKYEKIKRRTDNR